MNVGNRLLYFEYLAKDTSEEDQTGRKPACLFTVPRTHWCKSLVSMPLQKYSYQARWMKNTVQIYSLSQEKKNQTCWQAPNMSILFFSRIPASLLEGQMIFAQRVSGKKVTPYLWRLVLSFSRPWWMYTFKMPNIHNGETYPILTVSGKLFRFRVEEEPAILFYLRKEKLQHTYEWLHMWTCTHLSVNNDMAISNC